MLYRAHTLARSWGVVVSMQTKDKLQSLAIDRTAAARRGVPVWVFAGMAGLTVAAIVGAQFLVPRVEHAVATSASQPPQVFITTDDGVSRGVVASGYVTARRSATISTDIPGRLTSVLFEEGASVEEGQLLAELDDGLARYDLQLAQARLQSAKATVQAVKAELKEGEAQLWRAQELIKTSTVSPVALETAKSKIQSLTARYDSAIADATIAQVAVDRQTDFVERHKIRAPFKGVIIAKHAQSGETLSPSAGGSDAAPTGIATLVDMTSLEVEVDVSEGQIAHVSKGQKASVTLDAYPELDIPGEVLAVIPTADRDRATIQVRVSFTKLDPRILPQMAAKVTFERLGK